MRGTVSKEQPPDRSTPEPQSTANFGPVVISNNSQKLDLKANGVTEASQRDQTSASSRLQFEGTPVDSSRSVSGGGIPKEVPRLFCHPQSLVSSKLESSWGPQDGPAVRPGQKDSTRDDEPGFIESSSKAS